MRFKTDFVTNSSSTSFIISTKDIDYDFLVNVVLKDFRIELMKENGFTNEEIVDYLSDYNFESVLNNKNSNIGLFIKTKSEVKESYEYGWCDCEPNKLKDESGEKFYVIDNNCTGRYPWKIIREIFTDKYNIKWKYGYCD